MLNPYPTLLRLLLIVPFALSCGAETKSDGKPTDDSGAPANPQDATDVGSDSDDGDTGAAAVPIDIPVDLPNDSATNEETADSATDNDSELLPDTAESSASSTDDEPNSDDVSSTETDDVVQECDAGSCEPIDCPALPEACEEQGLGRACSADGQLVTCGSDDLGCPIGIVTPCADGATCAGSFPDATCSCAGAECDCAAANAGDACGTCGGEVLCDGSCSIQDPADLGEPCGGCGGEVLCDGSCSVQDPPDLGEPCDRCGTVICDGSCALMGMYPPGEMVGGEVNSSASDDSFSMSQDGLTAFVSSTRAGSAGGGYNLWMLTRSTLEEEFGTATPVDELNSDEDERSVSYTERLGLPYIYFSRSSASDLDIWGASFDNGWGTPFSASWNSEADEADINMTQQAFFGSDRPGGLGGWDIYLGVGDQAENAGAPFNSADDDSSLVTNEIGFAYFFGSTRPGGLGDWDIWRIDFEGNAVNFDVLNSEGLDFPLFYTADGCELYYGSNIAPGSGYDIYVSRFIRE